MKPGIHPDMVVASVSCICGAETYQTYSTRKEIRVEVCSQCHPFYTGKQRTVLREGQVEKFRQRYKIEDK
ncbi:MAG: 50S ribosomal protein L31 [Candidatus Eremiobacterota bacterium]